MALRVVLDARVVVAAVRSDRGVSRLLLTRALRHGLTMLASLPLMIEYEAALVHPHSLGASGISSHAMHAFVDALAAAAEPVRLTPLWHLLLRDPADDAALETAVQGSAQMLVTLNPQAFSTAAHHGGVVVLSPAEAIAVLNAS